MPRCSRNRLVSRDRYTPPGRVLALAVAVIAAVSFALLWWVAPITIGHHHEAPGGT